RAWIRVRNQKICSELRSAVPAGYKPGRRQPVWLDPRLDRQTALRAHIEARARWRNDCGVATVEDESLANFARSKRDPSLESSIISPGDVNSIALRRPPTHESRGRLNATCRTPPRQRADRKRQKTDQKPEQALRAPC